MSEVSRPDFFQLQNGSKANLPFSDNEYENRLAALRKLMAKSKVDAMLLTSMHNIAYYSGFLYCSFGRPYAAVITADRCVTVSANIDGGQPWRRCFAENLIYTDWKRNNYWRAVKSIIPKVKRIGIEGDHMTLASREMMSDFFSDVQSKDLNQAIMTLRMVKSPAEIELIKGGARTADIGGEAIRDAI
ncbi:MAG: creatinase, partial [Gammaproteobacteria bacterium]